ncbi:MAG: hypothetical protein VX916_01955 [Planctomycetota bacterium]|nr:hypothetical protein [Planctomycetota bacterium]
MSRIPFSILTALLLGFFLAEWATPLGGGKRPVVVLAADFDSRGGDGTGSSTAPQADVGAFEILGPKSVFKVKAGLDGDGELYISDIGAGAGATLRGEFTEEAAGRIIRFRMQVEPQQSTSGGFVTRAEDAGEGTMIDVEWGGGGLGHVKTGSSSNPGSGGDDGGGADFTYEGGVSYFTELTIYNTVFGPAWYELTLDDGRSVQKVSGVLPGKIFNVEKFDLIRPSGASPGVFIVDDLSVVTSPQLGLGS